MRMMKIIYAIHDRLPDFIHDAGSMQKFTRYGDRKDYPELTDEQWAKVGWDSLQDCFTCENQTSLWTNFAS